MNTAQVSTHLEQVKDRQFCFKSATLQRMACRIVRTALQHGAVWPDEVPHADIPKADRNCIGSTYRMLCNSGILLRESRYRRSESDESKGRTIFRYAVQDPHLGLAFLRRNDSEPTGQLALL